MMYYDLSIKDHDSGGNGVNTSETEGHYGEKASQKNGTPPNPSPCCKSTTRKKNIPRYGPIISQAHARVFTITRVHGAVDRCAPSGWGRRVWLWKVVPTVRRRVNNDVVKGKLIDFKSLRGETNESVS